MHTPVWALPAIAIYWTVVVEGYLGVAVALGDSPWFRRRMASRGRNPFLPFLVAFSVDVLGLFAVSAGLLKTAACLHVSPLAVGCLAVCYTILDLLEQED